MSPILVSSFILMLLAGWNLRQATESRKVRARLTARQRELAAEQAVISAEAARVAAESRRPHLFPARVYDLTRVMLAHAVRGELDALAKLIRAESSDTCQLVLDQCVAIADTIINGRTPVWPPAEDDLRLVAAITTSGIEDSGEEIARAAPADVDDDAVYAYLSHVVVHGKRVEDVFTGGDPAVPPIWITAAMLISFLPARPWQGHLNLIWELTALDGVNASAQRALEARTRRLSA